MELPQERLQGLYPHLRTLLPTLDPILVEMEEYGTARGFPLIGPLVGQMLLLHARTIGARRILEMGSGYGYSAAWFAQSRPDTTVLCTEGSTDNRDKAADFHGRLGIAERVDFRVGHAQEIVAALPEDEGYDIIFCDVDKEGYPDCFDLALPRLRVGGLLVFDNVLWSGYAWSELPADPPDYLKRMTPGVRALGEKLRACESLHTSVIPLRDGVSVSLKLR